MTKLSKQSSSRIMHNVSKIMAATMAVSPLVAVVPGAVSAEPAPVTSITDLAAAINNGTNIVSFTFTAPTGATSVDLQQSTDGGSNFSSTNSSLIADSTSATVTGLSFGDTYQFRLSVTGGTYEGYSNIQSITPIPPIQTGEPVSTPVPSQSSENDLISIDQSVGTIDNSNGIKVILNAGTTVAQLVSGLQISSGASIEILDSNEVAIDSSSNIPVESNMFISITSEDGHPNSNFSISIFVPQIPNASLLGGNTVHEHTTRLILANPDNNHSFYALSSNESAPRPFVGDSRDFSQYINVTDSSNRDLAITVGQHIALFETNVDGLILGYSDFTVSESDMGSSLEFAEIPFFASFNHLASQTLQPGQDIVTFKPFENAANYIHLDFPHSTDNNTLFTDLSDVTASDFILQYDSGGNAASILMSSIFVNDTNKGSNLSIDFELDGNMNSNTRYTLKMSNSANNEIILPVQTFAAEGFLAISNIMNEIETYNFNSVIVTSPVTVPTSARANVSGNEIVVTFDRALDSSVPLNKDNFVLSKSGVSVTSAEFDSEHSDQVILKLDVSIPNSPNPISLGLKDGAVVSTDGSVSEFSSNIVVSTADVTIDIPTDGPKQLAFDDHDTMSGMLSGVVTAVKADNETNIAFYYLFWANANGEIDHTDPIAFLRPNGADLAFTVPNGTLIPEGATQLTAQAVNSNGFNPDPAFLTIEDNVAALPLKAFAEDPIGTENNGKTKIHIMDSVTNKNDKFVYKNIGNVLLDELFLFPSMGDILDAGHGYADLPADGIVNAVQDNLILVAEVNRETGAVYRFGTAIAQVKQTAPMLNVLTFTDVSGFANNGQTQIHLPVSAGHAFKYTYLENLNPMLTMNVGDNTNNGGWQAISDLGVIQATNGQLIGVAEVDTFTGQVYKYSVGTALVRNEVEFPENTFSINKDNTVHLDHSTPGRIIATVHIVANGDHAGNEAIIFQLMKGTTPVALISLEADIQEGGSFTAQFDNIVDPANASYTVQVSIVSQFSNNTSNLGLSLAAPKILN